MRLLWHSSISCKYDDSRFNSHDGESFFHIYIITFPCSYIKTKCSLEFHSTCVYNCQYSKVVISLNSLKNLTLVKQVY